jgi:hypothetical protein
VEFPDFVNWQCRRRAEDMRSHRRKSLGTLEEFVRDEILELPFSTSVTSW